VHQGTSEKAIRFCWLFSFSMPVLKRQAMTLLEWKTSLFVLQARNAFDYFALVRCTKAIPRFSRMLDGDSQIVAGLTHQLLTHCM
jgi:hypothetical protein